MTGRCGTCCHWDQAGPQASWSFSLRLAELPDETPAARADRNRDAENSYGLCEWITRLDRDDPIDESRLPDAFAQDASDFEAYVYTRAAFGCTLWQARE